MDNLAAHQNRSGQKFCTSGVMLRAGSVQLHSIFDNVDVCGLQVHKVDALVSYKADAEG